MNYRLLIPVMVALVVSCQSGDDWGNYKLVYKNDKDGTTLTGSKEELVQHIRGGADIKIGWGVKGTSHTIEHIANPIWVAVLDESEVVAHLDAQVLSQTDWQNLSANYADSTLLQQEWRVVITTKGEFDAVWIDRTSKDVMKRRPQNHIISWFARGTMKNEPFFSTKKE